MKHDDPKFDEFLGQGLLGESEYDEILKRVLARTVDVPPLPPKRGRAFTWSLVPAAAAVAGAALAAWLIFLHPVHEGVQAGVQAGAPEGAQAGAALEGLSVKGAATGASGVLDIGCAPSSRRTCRAGDTLLFTVNTALTSGYLGAYAERVGDPARGRIWYFPGTSGNAPFVPTGTGTFVLPLGIQIGPEHALGSYRVTLWISDRPLERGEVARAEAGVVRSRALVDLEVAP